MTSDDRESQHKADEAAELSAEVVGALSGAGLGGLVAGPLGGFVGAGAGPVVARGVRAAIARFRSRGEQRIVTTVARIGERIRDRQRGGERLRDDGFLAGSGSDGEEVAEGVLLVAEREFESRKVPLYAELMASIAFTSDVDRATANLSVRLMERLSFRQLCLLVAFSRAAVRDKLRKHGFKGQVGDEKGKPAIGWMIGNDAHGILLEALELEQLGLIRRSDAAGVMHFTDIEPRTMRLEGIGAQLVRLALDGLSNDEVLELVAPLVADEWTLAIED